MSKTREEAIAAGVKIAETHHNMKRRKPWHDYHCKGTYMLTMVVEGRMPLLGRLVMPTQQLGAHVELTELGKAIYHEEVLKIPVFYKTVEVWKLCIMPDHIHMIVRVKEDMPDGKHLGDAVRGFKVGCTRAWWRLAYGDVPAGKAAGIVDDARTAQIAGDAKAAGVVVPSSTPAVSPAGKRRSVLFESGYNDQKEVMREAMDRGYRIISVRENGFPPLYKPAGESFDACSKGRLLQVSPWPYHMERRTISREQCLMLNRLVETITLL